MITLMMFVSGCANTRVIDSFCLWAKPVDMTHKDAEVISDRLAYWIDDYMREYTIRCGQKH